MRPIDRMYERLNERERKAKKKIKPLRRYVEMSSAKPPNPPKDKYNR